MWQGLEMCENGNSFISSRVERATRQYGATLKLLSKVNFPRLFKNQSCPKVIYLLTNYIPLEYLKFSHA